MNRGSKLAAFALGVFALTLSNCGGDDASPKDGIPPWSEVAKSLSPGLDRTSANPCQNGDRVCLDILEAEMRRRLQPLEEACDHNALFATMYLRMTEEIQGAYDDGELQDPAATSHFTAWFANYYFRAFDDWKAGRIGEVPEAWQVAFRAADDRDVRGLGNLLLGMNAHVSRDLPYVVSDVLTAPLDRVDPDYDLVNELIENLSAGLLREVSERFDPTVVTAELPIVIGGASSFGAFVTLWRSESWVRGNQLLSNSDRAATEQLIEFDATARALAILPETSYLPFIETSADRDAFCKAHR